MIYPEFLKENDLIGICAPSKGVGHKLDELEESNEVLRQNGYRIKETKSVRKNNDRSASAKQRAREMEELICDPEVKAVLCAAGGDYMLEMMPYVDFDRIKENPKWIIGMSDPTNILYTVTTKLDIATLYGFNGAGFRLKTDRQQNTFFNYLKGKTVKQNSYKRYITFLNEISEIRKYEPVCWTAKNDMKIEGRLIGGCVECIEKLIGTSLDDTNAFLERHKDDGIVWFFDVFSMSAYDFYLTLLQYRNAGWFRYCKGVLIGRVAFPRIDDPKLDYIKAADKALGRIPHICEMDIGHTSPKMTLINGAYCKVEYRDGKGSISFQLK